MKTFVYLKCWIITFTLPHWFQAVIVTLCKWLDSLNYFIKIFFFFFKSLLYRCSITWKQYYMLDIAFMSCYRKRTIYMFGYLFTLFSAYFAPILFPYLRSKLSRYHRASYKLSKFIAFKNIWNHFEYLFTKSELDRGQSPPAIHIYLMHWIWAESK